MIFRSIRDIVAKIENTATMITAALVTTPALLADAADNGVPGHRPRQRSSRMRLSRNT